MTYTMFPATEDDARELAPLLRAGDLAEIAAQHGRPPVDILVESVRASTEAVAGRADGRLICIGGVGSLTLIGRIGVPWLMGTDLIDLHRREFMRQTRTMIERFHDTYPVLRNVVDARYDAAIRWLRWLGFSFGAPVPMGVSGLPFLPFEKEI